MTHFFPDDLRRPPGALLPVLAALAVLSGCGKGGTSPASTIDCDGIAATTLVVGAHAILDPSLTQGCLRLPAAGASGAEHVVVALSAAGQETPNGVQSDFVLQATTDTFPVPALRRPALVQGAPASAQTVGPRRVTLVMTEHAYRPSKTLKVRRGETIAFTFLNKGKVLHEALIAKGPVQRQHEKEMASMGAMAMADTKDRVSVRPGKVKQLTFTFDQTGTYQLACHQPNHYKLGMQLAVEVV